MMLLMTAAPIAAVNRHHTIEQGAFIVQWHMVERSRHHCSLGDSSAVWVPPPCSLRAS